MCHKQNPLKTHIPEELEGLKKDQYKIEELRTLIGCLFAQVLGMGLIRAILSGLTDPVVEIAPHCVASIENITYWMFSLSFIAILPHHITFGWGFKWYTTSWFFSILFALDVYLLKNCIWITGGISKSPYSTFLFLLPLLGVVLQEKGWKILTYTVVVAGVLIYGGFSLEQIEAQGNFIVLNKYSYERLHAATLALCLFVTFSPNIGYKLYDRYRLSRQQPVAATDGTECLAEGLKQATSGN